MVDCLLSAISPHEGKRCVGCGLWGGQGSNGDLPVTKVDVQRFCSFCCQQGDHRQQ